MKKYGDNHDKLKRPRNRGNVLSQALKQKQNKIVETAYVEFFNGTWKMGWGWEYVTWGWGGYLFFFFIWLVITCQDNYKQKFIDRSSVY